MPAVNGMTLRALREALGVNRIMLERKSGESRVMILAIEQRKRKRAHPGTIHKLAAALGVEPTELIA
jgi:transcriptional regulator with XRE-family HTH domain